MFAKAFLFQLVYKIKKEVVEKVHVYLWKMYKLYTCIYGKYVVHLHLWKKHKLYTSISGKNISCAQKIVKNFSCTQVPASVEKFKLYTFKYLCFLIVLVFRTLFLNGNDPFK